MQKAQKNTFPNSKPQYQKQKSDSKIFEIINPRFVKQKGNLNICNVNFHTAAPTPIVDCD